MRVFVDVSNFASTLAGLRSHSHVKGDFLTDAVLQPILTYGLIIGLAIFCLMMPFIGWYCRSCRCGLRSCGCIRRCFRVCGIDKFDDFDVMFLVHEAAANSSNGKQSFAVRITAGRHTVSTETHSNGIFQENLSLTVEQGVSEVKVELVGGWNKKIAQLLFDPVKDIIETNGCTQKTFNMKVKQKGVIQPQVKLTYRVQKATDEESPLAAASTDRNLDFLVSEQLRMVGWTEAISDPREQLQYLARACSGPIDRFGTFGEKVNYTLAIRGPPMPKMRRFLMGFWKGKQDVEPAEEIDILRITGVKPDPGRPEVFFIYYVDENRVRQHIVLRRIDRTREVWIKLLTMFISEVHALKQQAHKQAHK